MQLIPIKVAIVSVALLSSGCSLSPRQTKTGSCAAPDVELGIVELSVGTPKNVSLGAGTNCTITPTALPGGGVHLELAVETRIPESNATRLWQTQFPARPGEHQTVPVDGLLVGITPKLKAL